MQKPPPNPKEKFLNRPMLTTMALGALSLFAAVSRRYGGVLNKVDMGDKGCKAILLLWNDVFRGGARPPMTEVTGRRERL